MAIITLTTDFGLKDHSVAVVKGAIYSELPDAKIVDISHHIAPFNIQECAYVLENSYGAFPKGSIHVVGVDAAPTAGKKHIAVLVNGHYFIAANTGVVGLITAGTTPEKIVEIAMPNSVKDAFPTASIFVPVACHLARGGTLEVVGKPYSELNTLREFTPRVADGGKQLVGNVIYVDNYGNVVTNIKKPFFDAYAKGRAYQVQVRNHKLKTIYHTYSDVENNDNGKGTRQYDGTLLALFNSNQYLELAIYRSNLQTVGGASTLLGLEYRDTVIVDFL
ncbi:S-adenosyl-l-methionine hydroxide adenosyltransferase family protein [Maribacter sp. 2307ULW6-5]|uniref:SAM hydrolase/SAM-dependent halogenase family protein n=1 Tax=Maribacter sp. 2307ULW6-5 TaxID=3386275 RepID=UPI0039BCD3B9